MISYPFPIFNLEMDNFFLKRTKNHSFLMDILLVFIKNPIKGKVKTRLAATIGDQQALLIYQKLLMVTKMLAEESGVCNWVYYSDEIIENDIFSTGDFIKKKQLQTPDLGARMKAAFEDAFAAGAKKTVIIGSDCPELTPTYLHEMFAALDNAGMSICPTEDGGYAALGLCQVFNTLFEGIEWSTQHVFKETIHHFIQANTNLPYFCTQISLRDIDTYEDYQYYKEKYNF